MALTGCGLFIFLIIHLAGNLQVFFGPEGLNRYGQFLQSEEEILWVARSILIVLVVLHIISAIRLSLENRAARPIPYNTYEVAAASYAARTMLWSGIIIACFVIYHILHFTVQVPDLNMTGQNFRVLEDTAARHDVYRMMVLGFSRPLISAFYILGIGLLCLHLSHGVSSMFQSLGWRNATYAHFIGQAAKVVGVLTFLGYCSIPLGIMLGVVK